MDCYGRHHGKRQECASCQLSDYCKDAADIPLLRAIQIDESKLIYEKSVFDEDSHEDERGYIPVTMYYNLQSSITASLSPLFSLCIHRPELGMVVERHVFQGESYSDVATALGITKQAVHKRMLQAVGMVPSLANVSPFDHRLYRGGAMSRAIESKAKIKKPKGVKRENNPNHCDLFSNMTNQV